MNSWGSYRQRLVVVVVVFSEKFQLTTALRVLFAGGGAIGEQAWAGGDGSSGQCGHGGCVLASGSVWALVERVAGLLLFL